MKPQDTGFKCPPFRVLQAPGAQLDAERFFKAMFTTAVLYGCDKDLSAERLQALYDVLVKRDFTDHELAKAIDWCIDHCRFFPMPSDLIGCPELARNADKGAPRRER